MSKFTAEERLEAVLRYLNGKESYREIGKSISVDHKSIVNWIKQYEHNGVTKCDIYIDRHRKVHMEKHMGAIEDYLFK